MGHKVNPIGFRLAVKRSWQSTWMAERRVYVENLHSDLEVRKYLKKRLANAAVGSILIERPRGEAHVLIYTARPGVVIGKKGEDIDALSREVAKKFGMARNKVHLSICEIRKPEIDAAIVADGIAKQLEKRGSYRRAMKRAVQSALRLRVLGIKICVSGRLNGAEIARKEWQREGRVPLHTLKADIRYGFAQAVTTYGLIGVKVWIYPGQETYARTSGFREKNARNTRGSWSETNQYQTR